MNKVVTDGLTLTPPQFELGLDVWSSEDGRPGQATYDGASNATLIAADSDFGSCLEMLKTESTQQLRYTGETPFLVGCYWRIRARVKAISGPLPTVRIAAWAGAAGGSHASVADEAGPAYPILTHGQVIEVTAIVGSGNRTGNDMVWGQTPVFGHFGIDLTGPDGGVVRIDDIVIEDVTSFFNADKLDVVDVRDYGAVGDGITNNRAAFEAADAAAAGRTVLVPEGVYQINDTITIASEIRFHGTLSMPDDARLELLQNFNFPDYYTAFGDEQLAFEKAVQALFHFTDHDSLDLCGRSVSLTRPVDVHALVGTIDEFGSRRVIRNGTLNAVDSPDWDDVVVTGTASYSSTSNATLLSNVTGISSIAPGSLITGNGVGREVYVRKTAVGNSEITTSRGLFGAYSSQSYTYTRFQYMLDFSGFTKISRFVIDQIDFACNGRCSGILLADTGIIFHVKDCFFTSPKDRAITSKGEGCSGMMLDRNQFLSNEQALAVSQRTSIGFNVNANDCKIRHNRAPRFHHWGVISGTGHMIIGNHFFQGDPTGGTLRTAGLVMTDNSCKSTITGNYIDNAYIEWTNEHDATPSITSGFSFSTLTIDGNVFTASDVDSWFTFVKIKPYGTGHFLNQFAMTGNVFKLFNGSVIDRVEEIDTTYANLDFDKFRAVHIANNGFLNVTYDTVNPVEIEVNQSSASTVWTGDASLQLPFGAKARFITGLAPNGGIKNTSNVNQYVQPWASGSKGTGGQFFEINWPTSVYGKIWATVRCDRPY